MKKLLFLTLALSMIFGFVCIVSAAEFTTGSVTHKLGVDLRTRFISQQGFTGDEDVDLFNQAQQSQDNAESLSSIPDVVPGIPPGGLNMEAEGDDPIGDLGYFDLRTRFNYVAMFDKNLLKFIAKADFYTMSELSGEKNQGITDTDRNNPEFDSGTDDFAVDLTNLSVEYNPYFKRGNYMFKAGWRHSNLANGLMSDQEGAFSVLAVVKLKKFLALSLNYKKSDGFGVGPTRNKAPLDIFTFKPVIRLSRTDFITAFWSYARGQAAAEELDFMYFPGLLDKIGMHQVGVDINFEREKFDFWFACVKQLGDARLSDSDNAKGLVFAGIFNSVGETSDFDGFSLGLGGKIKPSSIFDIHGEFLYSTGEPTSNDDPAGLKDNKLSQMVPTGGNSHPWAEIMGLGMFGNQSSLGSPGDSISNLIAYNLGATVNPTEKLSLSLDGWVAELEEKDGFGNDDLGVELDLKVGYEITNDLKLDIVAAHLWAGDATSINDASTKDPSEIGMQLTCKF